MSPTASRVAGKLPAAADDESIPMLTERLALPPLDLDTSLPREEPQETSVPATGEPIAGGVRPAEPTMLEPPAAAPLAVATASPAAPALTVPSPLPSAAAPAAAAPATAPLKAPAPVAAYTPAPAPTPAPASDEPSSPSIGAHWTRIEMALRESILQQLADDLPQQVDAIVRTRMGEAIDRLVQQLAAETRLAVASSLRDIVEHAVRAELDRLRGKKR